MTDRADGARVEWTDPETFDAVLDRVETREKGHHFEFFEPGRTIEHDRGLELTRAGAERWTAQTLNHDPAYWRSDAARARGFDEPPIHPDYLLAATMGPSVADCSEKGGYFLGRTGVRFHETATPGIEVHVRSTVRNARPSSSRPEYGVVTWETEGYDADGGEVLVSYERTNMVPRREPAATDGGEGVGTADGDGATGSDGSDGDGEGSEPDRSGIPEPLVTPDGDRFEDFAAALDEARGQGGAVAYRHERGRTVDRSLVAALPLATLNTARQHHDRHAMADAPSGDVVNYGDVTRSIALGHARSDEATYRERRFDDERFHGFVTPGDTVYAFSRVLDADPAPGPAEAGEVTFEHVAFDQDRRPVYSGTRTALVRRSA